MALVISSPVVFLMTSLLVVRALLTAMILLATDADALGVLLVRRTAVVPPVMTPETDVTMTLPVAGVSLPMSVVNAKGLPTHSEIVAAMAC
mmetsp:Transcript_32838/g.76502  ORF Transcript_32838/g.76502 Transcript_32838/m.76502 type:complete len:91 (+) Transcript_32838:1195-1467(+)